MNFTGFWYSPARAGEGINIEEHSDGRVFAVFFTLGGGVQKYYPCDGARKDDAAVLKAYAVSGEPGSAKEVEVGTITLRDMAAGVRLNAFVGSAAYNYDLQRWYTVGSVPVPEPEPEPEPEPPPVIIPAGLKLETKTRWQPAFYERQMPYEGGSSPIPSENITAAYQWNSFKVTNNGTEPVLIKPSKSGPNNPKVSGISAAGVTLQPGQSVTATMSIGPLTVTNPGSVARSSYGLHLADDTRIAGCTVQIEYPR